MRWRGFGPVVTFLLLSIVWCCPLLSTAYAIPAVLSGKLFKEPWMREHAGSVMDQPTIGKWLVITLAMMMVFFPYLATVRWLSDRSRGTCRWILAVYIAFICLWLLCLLTIPAFWLFQYIDNMGWTPRRGKAVVVTGGMYLSIIGYGLWYIWPPRGKSFSTDAGFPVEQVPFSDS